MPEFLSYSYLQMLNNKCAGFECQTAHFSFVAGIKILHHSFCSIVQYMLFKP